MDAARVLNALEHHRMNDIDGLIFEMEAVRDAVWAKDKEHGLAAITEFLVHFVEVFGHSHNVFVKTFPLLNDIKDLIEAQDYEEATPAILAVLVMLRQLREALEK